MCEEFTSPYRTTTYTARISAFNVQRAGTGEVAVGSSFEREDSELRGELPSFVTHDDHNFFCFHPLSIRP